MHPRRELPSLDRIKEIISYDPETGLFTNIAKRGKCTPGSVSGTITPQGYLQIGIDWKLYLAHRLAWHISTGVDPGEFEIDHINGITTDNRISNLRLTSKVQNAQNVKIPKTNSTGVKGVYFDKSRNKFCAEIICNKIKYRLGRFDTLEEASEARKMAANALHGEFQRS